MKWHPHQKNKRGPRNPKKLDRQGWFDALAASTIALPVVGDVAGLAADANMYATDPESHNAFNYGMTALGALPFVPPASVAGKAVKNKIKAYHGSPHDFDEFKMSQIGTGEGAQAYGHGLYFAESEDVAKGYRDELTPRDFDYEAKLSDKYNQLAQQNDTVGMEIYELAMQHESPSDMRARLALDEQSPEFMAKANKHIDDIEKLPVNRGSMYQVEIDATPDELLDWDKPLSEQSEQVRAALNDKMPEAREALSAQEESWGSMAEDVSGQDWSGSDIYRALSKDKGGWGGLEASQAMDTSAVLKNSGIKGIKYKDGFSRGAEGGTSNYVIFDERLITIAKKYGLAVPAAAAILANRTGQDPETMYEKDA